MILSIQIVSFIVSFLYGMFFFITLQINYKFLYSSNLFIKIVFSFLFIIFHTLLYFVILLKINYGYIHLYFFFCLIIGYFVWKVGYNRFVNYKWLWYTVLKGKWFIMVKKRRRYTVKTKGRMFIIFMFFGAIIGTLGITFLHDLKRISDMDHEMKNLVSKKEELLEEEETIQADIKKLSDPLYVARYARERYFYSKEGEYILRMK